MSGAMSGALWKKEVVSDRRRAARVPSAAHFFRSAVGSISTPNFLRFLPDPTIDARVDARV